VSIYSALNGDAAYEVSVLSQMAQACLAEGSANVSYGFPADIWALGVLACELLTGASPFEGDTKEETYAKILTGNMQLPCYLSSEARDFIHKVCFEPHAGCYSLMHLSCLCAQTCSGHGMNSSIHSLHAFQSADQVRRSTHCMAALQPALSFGIDLPEACA